MQSIVYKGIFTSYGFFGVILFALGLFLLLKTKHTLYSKTSNRIYICGILSIVLSIVCFVLYIGQIKHFFM